MNQILKNKIPDNPLPVKNTIVKNVFQAALFLLLTIVGSLAFPCRAWASSTLRLMTVGDNLTHMGIVYSGRQEDGSLNYDFEFEPIKELLQAADIKVINQETPLAGNHLGFSGFPHFNSPTEIADAIEKAGFNVVLTATNHTFDQGIDGLIRFRQNFTDNHPSLFVLGSQVSGDLRPRTSSAVVTSQFSPTAFATTSSNSSIQPSTNTIAESEAATYYDYYDEAYDATIPILELADGSRIAMLNYTYGANTEVIPLELPDYLHFLCNYNKKTGQMDFTTLNPQVIKDIKAARSYADFVIVFPHWGTEYQAESSSYQQKFARQMTAAGANLIIGMHPHVVQPVEFISLAQGCESLCFYSLGNYVSTQQDARPMLEAIAWVTLSIDVTPRGEHRISINLKETGAIPTIMEYTNGKVRFQNICYLEDYTEEQCQNAGIQNYHRVTLEDFKTWSQETLGKYQISKKDALAWSQE